MTAAHDGTLPKTRPTLVYHIALRCLSSVILHWIINTSAYSSRECLQATGLASNRMLMLTGHPNTLDYAARVQYSTKAQLIRAHMKEQSCVQS